jgi:type I restriction enzyme M protein
MLCVVILYICRIIERENPELDGVLTNTKYNDKRKYPDYKLRKLISHFNSPRLRNSDLEREDIFGDAYEYLLEEFAEQTKKRGGEFFTPKEVVRLLVELVEPKEGMSICDPTCGSGGMLIESRKHVERSGGKSGITRHNERCQNDGFVYYGWRKGISNNKSCSVNSLKSIFLK